MSRVKRVLKALETIAEGFIDDDPPDCGDWADLRDAARAELGGEEAKAPAPEMVGCEKKCGGGKHIGPFVPSGEYLMSKPAQKVYRCKACGQQARNVRCDAGPASEGISAPEANATEPLSTEELLRYHESWSEYGNYEDRPMARKFHLRAMAGIRALAGSESALREKVAELEKQLDEQPHITLSLDGDRWCALLGRDLMEGTATFGETRSDALYRLAEALEVRPVVSIPVSVNAVHLCTSTSGFALYVKAAGRQFAGDDVLTALAWARRIADREGLQLTVSPYVADKLRERGVKVEKA